MFDNINHFPSIYKHQLDSKQPFSRNNNPNNCNTIPSNLKQNEVRKADDKK